jgi:hypothetical protein
VARADRECLRSADPEIGRKRIVVPIDDLEYDDLATLTPIAERLGY